MLDFDSFDVLSFDCYGTLIDWEQGILAALAPVFAAHRVVLEPETVLDSFGRLEHHVQAGPYLKYRVVLGRVLEGLSEKLGFTPSPEEVLSFSGSVSDWPAFPDSAAALKELRSKYRLAVISNIDDDLFAHSNRRLGQPFDWIVTAEQVGSYKPALRNFEAALERIGRPKEKVLHVAQSCFHDVEPARRLGLATVWVNRRHGREGSGATVPSAAEPDLVVPDLRTLATMAAAGGSPTNLAT